MNRLGVSRAVVIAAAALAASTVFRAAAQSPPAGVDAARWVLHDPPMAAVTTYLGRSSLYMYRGWAHLRDVSFEDGTLECDAAFHGHASFAGLLVRAEANGDGELIYVRPHRSRQPDAVQYAPLFNDGQETWQVYSGDGFTAAAEVPSNRWVHLKLEIAGRTARFYIDGATEPALVVSPLKREPKAGLAGVWSRLGSANITNCVATPAGAGTPARVTTPSTTPPAVAAKGLITRWQLSPAFDADKTSAATLPADGSGWDAVETEETGLLNIARFRRKVTPRAPNPTQNGRDLVFVRTTITADAARLVSLEFGYSDAVTVLLNGRPLFAGDSSFLRATRRFSASSG